jgi:hypothetical protein
MRMLARAGYAANGIVHILLGVLVLVVAGGGDGQTDQAGAFGAIAAAPMGAVALWAIAAALAALGLWHAVQAFLPTGDDTTKRLGRAATEAGQAIVFLALAVIAVNVALGARPQGDQSAQSSSQGVLNLPGGPFLLGAVGLGVAGFGVGFAVMGALRRFRKKLSMPSGTAGRALTALGVVGYVAKGIALAIVGILLLVAAITLDPGAAGGLDGAIHALLAVPGGVFLGVAVGVGLIAYGVFTVFRARYARLDA